MGGEWISYSEASCVPDVAQELADATDKKMPGWARNNPVQRIAHVEIREIS